MSTRKPSCIILDIPTDVVEHGHEDDSIFRYFWTCLTSFPFVLNHLGNLQLDLPIDVVEHGHEDDPIFIFSVLFDKAVSLT